MRFPEDAPRIVRVTGGLYSRTTALSEGALKVSELDRMSDVGIQARCVYEHVVTMAWLTGDRRKTTERQLLWQSEDDRKNLRFSREVKKLTGGGVLDDDTIDKIESDLEEMGNPTFPGVLDRAIRADRDWHGLLGFDDGLLNLTTWYTQIYRTTSMVIHPSMPGLKLVLDQGYRTAALEETGTAATTVGVVSALCIVATLVSAQIVGRPPLAEAEKALGRVMDIHGTAPAPD